MSTEKGVLYYYDYVEVIPIEEQARTTRTEKRPLEMHLKPRDMRKIASNQDEG
ncbi:MAG: hypothetical protein IPI16_16110 [Comamonadaceae bacterium]|uniref:hypothetical protein n=1 Tax=Candidatus Skiveiella danica TaxID=3386177 RepID=UPI002C0341AF|nr:hypothetical protein [Comamonadaceae bacterium]MBK7509558.1 hypothetical protein [Comamonadaceae bacterium]MBK9987859.1 hypothetical protein [Betaproteobacteria bacterium]HPL78783.1 hypothetical protein [Burkholderiaceae bacterium]